MELTSVFFCILEAHHLTQRSICRIIGFRSANQLTRILKGAVSDDLMLDFGRRLIEHSEELGLTEPEKQAILDSCLELGWGRDNLSCAKRFFALIMDGGAPALSPGIVMHHAAGGVIGGLKDVLMDAVRVHITAVNCTVPGLGRMLMELSGQCGLQVDFYRSDGVDLIQSIRFLETIWPMIHSAWFHPYQISRKDGEELPGLSGAQLLLVDAEDASGARESYTLLPFGENAMVRLDIPPDHLPYRQLLAVREQDVRPLSIARETVQDYARYLQFASRLEHNHRVVRIKSDIGLDMIPAEIQLAAMCEGALRDMPEPCGVLDQLYQIQDERYHNCLKKRQKQYHLFSYSAMARFVQTGMLSDHFWGFRPFTLEERLSILEDLKKRMMASPHFHLAFFRPDTDMIPGEITWYEGEGISLILRNSHYTFEVEDSHSELLYRDEGFSCFFSGFFLKWCMKTAMFSEAESLCLLGRLIAECRAKLTSGSAP